MSSSAVGVEPRDVNRSLRTTPRSTRFAPLSPGTLSWAPARFTGHRYLQLLLGTWPHEAEKLALLVSGSSGVLSNSLVFRTTANPDISNSALPLNQRPKSIDNSCLVYPWWFAGMRRMPPALGVFARRQDSLSIRAGGNESFCCFCATEAEIGSKFALPSL